METVKRKNTKGILIACVALVIVVAALFILYPLLREQPVSGAKAVTVSIVHKDGATRMLDLQTDQEYLYDAIMEEDDTLIKGDMLDFGLYIKTVDGETADEANQEWWRLSKDGEMTSTGISQTPIADGDQFELALVAGW